MSGEGHMMQPLFTIEQVELIRRLRSSGITKEEVIHAFDALDRLENELQPLSRSPSNYTNHHSSYKDLTNQKRSSPYKPNITAFTPPMSSENGPNLVESSGRNGFDLTEETCSTLSNNSSNDFALVTANVLRTPFVSGATDDNTEEIKELLKAGEDALCEEIRAFVQLHQITQNQIALNSGISQSYVSRYLRGDYCEMSTRSCRAIYRWYLSARKKLTRAVKSDPVIFTNMNPTDLVVSRQLSFPTELSPSSCVADPVPYTTQRRERFTFRPCHLEVLERYFSVEQYPTAEKREEISTACNQAIDTASLGRPLTEREKVHPHIVSNWFANRRKDLKKSARDGNVDNPSHLSKGRVRSASEDGQRLEPSSVLEDSDIKQPALDQLEEQSLSLVVEAAAVNQAILSLTGQPSLVGGVKPDLLTSQTVSFSGSESDHIDL